MNLTGIILAGGESTRMGSDKGWVPFEGEPLIKHVIKKISPFCDEILISANSSQYQSLGFKVVEDDFYNIGPIAGIASAMKFAKYENSLIISCDLPLVSAELLRTLIANIKHYDIVVPIHKGYIQPLCGVYANRIHEKILHEIQNGNFGLQYILKKLNVKILDEHELKHIDLSTELLNFNSKSDIDNYKNKKNL